MPIDMQENARQLGIALLVIFLWVGAWGFTEVFLEKHVATRLGRGRAYMLLFVIAFISILFTGLGVL